MTRASTIGGSERAASRWGRPLLVLVVLGALIAGYGWHTSLRLTPPGRARPAPPLRLSSLEGQAVALKDYRGRVVLINFWASWCVPCRREAPVLSRLEHELGPAGLTVLGVNFESLDPTTLRRAADRFGIDYPVLRPAGTLHGEFSPTGVLPYTWLIDRQGRIRAAFGGAAREPELARVCKSLIEEQ